MRLEAIDRHSGRVVSKNLRLTAQGLRIQRNIGVPGKDVLPGGNIPGHHRNCPSIGGLRLKGKSNKDSSCAQVRESRESNN